MIINCPSCNGLGTHMDGYASFGTKETIIRPATTCSMCKGNRKVRMTSFEPYEPDESELPKVTILPQRGLYAKEQSK